MFMKVKTSMEVAKMYMPMHEQYVCALFKENGNS